MSEVFKGSVESKGRGTTEQVDKEPVYRVSLKGSGKSGDIAVTVRITVLSKDERVFDAFTLDEDFQVVITRPQQRL